jgi:hypothetical protein
LEVLTEGLEAGCFLSTCTVGLTVTEGRLGDAGCLVTVPEGFELIGLVTVTLLLLDVVLEVPVVERDSPLRGCASAPDSNATNASAVRNAANVAEIVLIIVQFKGLIDMVFLRQ